MSRKRGSTLAEMVIVMAVVSIMSVMVVTFTILCNGWVHTGIARYNLTMSERTADGALRFFVSEFDNSDCYFSAEGSTLTVHSNSDPDFSYTLSYADSVLTYTTPDGSGHYPLDHITSLFFNVIDNPNTGRQLIRCGMSYSMSVSTSLERKETGFYYASVATRAGGNTVSE